MSTGGAYFSDVAVKQAALREVLNSDGSGWSIVADDAARANCAARFGLAPALVVLLGYATRFPFGDAARDKLHRMLDAIPLGADTFDVVRSWILTIWYDPEVGVGSRLKNKASHSRAAEVVRLIERTANAQVTSDEWRKARSALNRQNPAGATDELLLDLMASMAWDLNLSPGAVIDIWEAWKDTVSIPLARSAGWDAPVQERLFQAMRDALTEAHSRLGDEPLDGETPDEHGQRVSKEAHEVMTFRGNEDDFQRLVAFLQSKVGPAVDAWQRRAEGSLLSACYAATLVDQVQSIQS